MKANRFKVLMASVLTIVAIFGVIQNMKKVSQISDAEKLSIHLVNELLADSSS